MTDFFKKNKKTDNQFSNVWGTKSSASWNIDNEEPEDILYPTMSNLKNEIKKQ